MDRRTDGPTDKASYRVACPQLKKSERDKGKETNKGREIKCLESLKKDSKKAIGIDPHLDKIEGRKSSQQVP